MIQAETTQVMSVTPAILWAAAGVLVAALATFGAFGVFAVRAIVRESTTKELGTLSTNIAVLNNSLQLSTQQSERLREELHGVSREMGHVRRDLNEVVERVARVEGTQGIDRRNHPHGRRATDAHEVDDL